MNREEWREFQQWLETTSLEELREAQQKIEQLLPSLVTDDVIAEARQRLRVIEKEILLRLLK